MGRLACSSNRSRDEPVHKIHLSGLVSLGPLRLAEEALELIEKVVGRFRQSKPLDEVRLAVGRNRAVAGERCHDLLVA